MSRFAWTAASRPPAGCVHSPHLTGSVCVRSKARKSPGTQSERPPGRRKATAYQGGAGALKAGSYPRSSTDRHEPRVDASRAPCDSTTHERLSGMEVCRPSTREIIRRAITFRACYPFAARFSANTGAHCRNSSTLPKTRRAVAIVRATSLTACLGRCSCFVGYRVARQRIIKTRPSLVVSRRASSAFTHR